MTSLLIVESPAKCSKIQGFLGAGWRVIATMGHIRSLEEDLDAVGLERDFEPRFQFIKEKSKAIAQIKEAAAKASTIYLASDDDREGEAISYSVLTLLKLNPATTPRAVFREITESAVKAAVANPRRLDMNRVNAQQARAILDMMVGFTISPLLWKYVGPALSAGRCQTPALRLLVDQEAAIRAHTTSTVWKIKGSWATSARAVAFEAALTEELENEESATNFLENIYQESDAKVTSAETRPTTEQPPKPLITSTLQQEASATMSLQPKRTMQIAQRLYEAGHITYMRTDSAVLSEEAKTAAESWVRTTFGEEYVAAAGAKKAPVKSKSQATQPQEAHEAIRPTHIERTDLPADEDWTAPDRKLYKLIWNRAVQSVMAAAKGEQRTVDFVAAGDPMEFVWRAIWKRQIFAGWRRIGAAATNLDDEEEQQVAENNWATAEKIEVGVTLYWRSLEAWPHDSKPAARYTEATLVRELEKRGIGRPSTFAALVGTVIDKGYAEKRDTAAREVLLPRLRLDSPNMWPPSRTVEKKKVGAEKQKLAPTTLGQSVLEFCLREFPDLFNYEFTRTMETRLDGIADGAEAWKQLCRDTWGSYKEKYAALKSGNSTVAAGAARERHFTGGIKGVQSKKGPLLLKEGPTPVFYGWPEGKSFREITDAEVTSFVALRIEQQTGSSLGEHDGKPIVKKSGPFGTYAECDGVRVPCTEEDTAETICAKLQAKSQASLHTLGPFEFRNGPYGVFMFKKDLIGKARKFVGVPSGVDPKLLTQEAAIKIYQAGLIMKAKGKQFKKKNEAT